MIYITQASPFLSCLPHKPLKPIRSTTVLVSHLLLVLTYLTLFLELLLFLFLFQQNTVPQFPSRQTTCLTRFHENKIKQTKDLSVSKCPRNQPTSTNNPPNSQPKTTPTIYHQTATTNSPSRPTRAPCTSTPRSRWKPRRAPPADAPSTRRARTRMDGWIMRGVWGVWIVRERRELPSWMMGG